MPAKSSGIDPKRAPNTKMEPPYTEAMTKKMGMHGHSETRMFSDAPSMPLPGTAGDSMEQNTAVGSGSRPTPSKIKIHTSAPENQHTQQRGVPGALE